MPYQLDKWQWISGINMKILPGDYAVCYARIDPPFTTLVGYAGVLSPYLQVQEGNVEINSVGDWPSGPLPVGSDNRSFPENGNGKFLWSDPDEERIRLPTLEELSEVYIWHVGTSHTWGVSDQIIVNLKKLKEDYPDRSAFTISAATQTYHVATPENPPPDEYDPDLSPRLPLRYYVGLRTYVGDGGTFEFEPVTTRDPFNQSVEVADVAHYHGGQAEMSANFEKAAGPVITIYGQNNVFQLRRLNWNIDWKKPKQSSLSGGSIFTQSA